MGYTHYWKHPELPADLFAEIGRDARVIVGTVRARGIGIAGWDGTGEPEFSDEAISFNGVDPDDYETFTLTPEATEFNFTKTGERPYDLAVTAVLLRVAALAAKHDVKFEFWSDGDLDTDWADGRQLVAEVFA